MSSRAPTYHNLGCGCCHLQRYNITLSGAECAQIVGVLLVFTLMVGPAAAARNVSRRLGAAVALSAALALFEAWAA